MQDNDIVETYFQTKLILLFGNSNIMILGSNSKVLLNIAPGNASGKISTSITLFNGGVFTKTISDCHTIVYTTNAVCEMDSGSVSSVADGKTGETGFQVLAGTVNVRNISQQKGKVLNAGLTTMILPNKEPTAPLYITHRHVTVLQHFFGDEYIKNELEISGIKPTDDQSSKRLSISQNITEKTAKYVDQGMYKSLFSPEKIYGAILEDQQKFKFYLPQIRQTDAAASRGAVAFNFNAGIMPGNTKLNLSLSPSIRLSKFETGLQFRLSQNANSAMSFGATSLDGILDMVQFLRIGNFIDSNIIYVGQISNYSMGYGLVVDNFSNVNPNLNFNSAGVTLQGNLWDTFHGKAFLGNISTPYYGGLYLSYTPAIYQFGVGYYFDIDQYKTKWPLDNFRFIPMSVSETTVPSPTQDPANVHIFELNLGAEICSYYNFKMKLLLEYAQKLQKGNDGVAARIPSIIFDINKMQFGGGLVVETGRMLSSQFNPFYTINRLRLKNAANQNLPDTLITQNTYLSSDRRSTGISLIYRANPLNGMDVNVRYKQDFLSNDAINIVRGTTETDTISDIKGDFTLLLNFSINDSLVSFFKHAGIYFQQYHGKLYPSNGGFFSSWNMEFGFNFLTRPLFLNLAFEAGGKLLYIDAGKRLNNQIGSNESMFEIYAGLQWGFL